LNEEKEEEKKKEEEVRCSAQPSAHTQMSNTPLVEYETAFIKYVNV
jgi:hypothetical protein